MPKLHPLRDRLGTAISCLRVAIVSDLHAFDRTLIGSDSAPSFLDVSAPEDNLSVHPIAALRDLISKEGLVADALLCPGDLGDKAQPTSIKYAWDSVNTIATALGARHVIATAGNHDVDSRLGYTNYDAKGFLQSLEPSFPFADEQGCDRYWSRHYAVLQWQDARIVVLNSSAYHGALPKDNRPEYEHGRIAATTLDSLKRYLSTQPHNRVNILLCHHHPQPHEEFNLGAEDIMVGGAELLRALSTGDYGEWIVIHGHKHFPKISYAQGITAATPIILAAGSLCARLPAEIQSVARNQFYIIEFPREEPATLGLVGVFRAWDWTYGKGWQPAQRMSGLPHKGGFGTREKPIIVASKIAADCTKRRMTKWVELAVRLPEIRYMLPHDLERVRTELESTGTFKVHEIDGSFVQVDRLK